MSRIGKQPVAIPAGVTVTVEKRTVSAGGPKGELSLVLPPGISAEVAGGQVSLSRPDDTKTNRGFHGLARSLVANLVRGVAAGFSRELEIEGVGFRAAVQDGKLVLSLGYSAPIEYAPPAGVTVAVNQNVITVSGVDKQAVGVAAARIRSFYPPEPYKGKGVRYRGERIRRKAGKTVA